MNAEESFADQVRRHRRAAGLTQEELAEKAGLSARGISDLERGLKRRPHPETVRLLAAALDLSPGDLAALRDSASPPPSTETRRTLPTPMTSLLGREVEVQAIGSMLQPHRETRLVTLTGPGGVGKTRLSLQVATEVQDRFTGGVVFVGLASLDDPRLVLMVLAQALGSGQLSDRPALEQVIRLVGDRPTLIVLDNLEHLLSAASDIADVLAACPSCLVLATSRAPLRLTGERQVPVAPLALPDHDGEQSPDDLLRSPAAQLFVRQARTVAPNFELTMETAGPVATTCRRLEGLPLALELAAARLKVLSASELAEAVTNRLGVLTGGERDRPARHQNLRETIAWSYDLLDAREQSAMRSLAVFAGGATRPAAGAVLADGDDLVVVDLLEELLDQSLLQRREDAAGASRYAMLETIREFASEQLAASGDEAETRERHASWFLDFAERGEQELTGPSQAVWMRHLTADYDNLRAAIGWYVDQEDAERSQRMGSALWRYWAASGRLREARDWLDRALALDPEAVTTARGNALLRAGNVAVDLADYRSARGFYEESQHVFTTMGNEGLSVGAHTGLGLVLHNQGRYSDAQQAHQTALRLWRQRAWPPGVASALQNLASCAIAEEDYQLASQLLDESHRIHRDLGDDDGVAWSTFWKGILARLEGHVETAYSTLKASEERFMMLGNPIGRAAARSELGHLALGSGDRDLAYSLHVSALVMRDEAGDMQGVVESMEGVAAVAIAKNQCAVSLQLIAHAAEWRQQHEARCTPATQRAICKVSAAARISLGEQRYRRAWMTGRVLTKDEAIHLASSLVLAG